MSYYPLYQDDLIPTTPMDLASAFRPVYEAARVMRGKISNVTLTGIFKALRQPEPTLTEVVHDVMDRAGLETTDPVYATSVVMALQAQIRHRNDPAALRRIKAPLIGLQAIADLDEVPAQEKGDVLYALLRRQVAVERGESPTQGESDKDKHLVKAGISVKRMENIRALGAMLEGPAASGLTLVQTAAHDAIAHAADIPVPERRGQPMPRFGQPVMEAEVQVMAEVEHDEVSYGVPGEPAVEPAVEPEADSDSHLELSHDAI